MRSKKMGEEPKSKEPVRLRFKQLANGNKSIYLDIYQDGKRQYEFLKMYLVPETTPLDKHQNEETMRSAETIKSQRVIEINNGSAGIKRRSKGMTLDQLLDEYELSTSQMCKSSQMLTHSMRLILTDYAGTGVKLANVDKAFCKGLIKYLNDDYKKKNGMPLSERSKRHYLTRFGCALNLAVRNDYIDKNPLMLLSPSEKITVPKKTRAYLTVDEVQKIISADYKNERIKRAFLFSCFCGLRLGDIKRLKWSDLIIDGEAVRVALVQQKTRETLYLDLSSEAVRWLPERSGGDGHIFRLPTAANIEIGIAKWMKAAGINKHVTFHTARHTFATMMLTLGADLYTVSKLLGHTKIETTQIYAEVIDQKKKDAVNLVNGLFSH